MRNTFETIRIPTILGLGLLFTALFLGFTIYSYNQEVKNKIRQKTEPQIIKSLNLTDYSASIAWETVSQATGEVLWSEDLSLSNVARDDRDLKEPMPHFVHFATIKGLREDTQYFYKIKSDTQVFPEKALSFKTPKKLSRPEESEELKPNKPLSGKVLTPDFSPVQEALVLLNLSGANSIGTITSTAGNFLLPLSDLRNQNLDQYFLISQNTPAKLEIRALEKTTQAQMKFPAPATLPDIIVGQDIDLSQIITSPAIGGASLSAKPKNKLDLNNDGKINSVDLSIVMANKLKRGENPADVNNDKVVDQKDIDLVKKAL